MKSTIKLAVIIALATTLPQCNKTEAEEIENTGTPVNNIHKLVAAENEAALPFNSMPVYYGKDMQYIRYRLFTGAAAKELLAQSPVVNTMYVYDEGLLSPEGMPLVNFATSLTPANGKETVWKIIQVKINRGMIPQQFYTEHELISAIRPSEGMITLISTDNAYEGHRFEYKMQVDDPEQQ